MTGHRESGRPVVVDAEADTIVVYMCQRTIREIAGQLLARGKSALTCVAIVRGASWPTQEVYTGYLGELAALPEHWYVPLDPEAPTIAIIGDVASYADQLAWHGSRLTPLDALLSPTSRKVAGGAR